MSVNVETQPAEEKYTKAEVRKSYVEDSAAYKPMAPGHDKKTSLTQEEINDLFAMRRMLKALCDCDDGGDVYSLSTRISIHDLGLGFILQHELEEALEVLTIEIDHCFPDEEVADWEKYKAEQANSLRAHAAAIWSRLPADLKDAMRAAIAADAE